MPVLHCTWCRDEETPFFFVWGESERVHLRDVGIHSSATAKEHPFQSSCEELSKACSAITAANQTDSNEKAHSVVASFLLPTTANGVPQLSSAQADDSAVSLKRWKIKGLGLDPKQAIPFLLRVSDSVREGRSSIVVEGDQEIRLGSDLLYWSKAAKFLLEPIARQRFLPYFSKENSPHYRSTWLLAPTDDADSARFEHLAGEMPPVCRAASGEDPRSLLTAFLNHSADIMIRQFAGEGALLDAESGAALWYNGLFAPKSPKVAAKVADGLVSWADEVLARGSSTDPYRTCFRLEAPDGGNRWSLEYLLQSVRDPSLIIPAESVWNEKNTAQERLLSDLAKASKFFKPIDRSLESSPAPTHGKLTIDEAYSFLKESAWLLRESGFGVQIPHWLEGEGTRLKIQLNVKSPRRPNTKAGEGSIFTITNLAQFDWKIALSGQNGEVVLSEEEFMALAALKQPIVEFRGEWVELRKEDVDSALMFLENQKKQGGIHVADLVRFASAPESQSLPVEIASCDGWIGGLIRRLKEKKNDESIADISAPKHFVGTMRPYQLKGFSWLAFMRKWGLGACLADDMGLGKTIQFIALLLRGREVSSKEKPTLLVCPTSIVGNWKRELGRFSPSIRAMIHHGSDRISDAVEFAKAVTNCDVVMSTYSLIQRDVDLLSSIEWRTVVLDEAQNVKNHWTKQSQAVRKLKSEHRVALTGTPIENRLSELWSIMDFLNPGYLGSFEEFRRKYSVPVERYGDDNTQKVLQRIVQPFILRRLKTDRTIITDLPKKNEMKVFCSLTEEQASLYEAHVTKMLEEIEASEGIQRRGLVLSALTRLKQICDHPALYLADRSSLASRSGKLERLKEMLEEVVEEKEKALVFTQFSKMGEMIKLYLERETGYEVPFLYGGVPRKKRDEMVARFQENSSSSYLPVFVISLKAGGLGLNLTAANHVFHYDRWWNPAVENQATDRAFRIGQKKNVQVHKFVSAGTLEEMIDSMIERKKGLAENILGTGEQWLTELSTKELKGILTLRRE